ncbi:MAG: DNA polymerase I [Planctomycetota bacterium]
MNARQKELEKKLFLLDAMALIYRAHFALIRSPRYTSGGVCTSAVFGVANTVLDLINTYQPSHLAVALDTRDPTFRHEVFPEYKAQRDELPEEIANQFPLVDRLFDALGITMIRVPGFEADDIIGTLAKEASKLDFHTYMVTPDKDYTQLVSDSVTMLKPGRQGGRTELLSIPEVLKQWQIESVDQVIDVLGLMGDSSDNIPGVPGIGPKTAQKLIAKFGTVEELLANTNQLKGKQKERVEEHREQALLSKQLVTIKTDVPHEIEIEKLSWDGIKKNNDALKSLFVELEFDTLGKRLFGKSFSTAPARQQVIRNKREKEIQATLFDDEPPKETSIAKTDHNYVTVKTAKGRQELIKKLRKQERFCFDTETTGLNPRIAFPLGIAFSFEKESAYYVPLPEKSADAIKVLEEFRDLFEDESITKVGHNLKYDISLLKWHGFEVRGKLLDTMLMHSMKEPEMRHGLDYLAKLYLGYTTISITDLIGKKGDSQRNLKDIPVEIVSEYACEDADITLQVADVISPDIENRGVSQVCYDVECPLIPVLVDIEYEGIRLDVDALNQYSRVLEQEIAELQDKIFVAAGREFNIASPKQLGIVLYEDLKLVEKPKKTATGQYSTREAELLKLANKYQIVADVLEYRNAVKLKSVYVDQLPAAVHPETGRLHTHYLQTWTATGRMQSNNPNLQTIPVRKERGREIRAAFVPRDDDYLILAADYSQIELRIMAALSKDPGMMEAFHSKTDIHTVTASKVYKVAMEEVDREMRAKAKMVNFGILYGISAFGLQQRLNIPRKEANSLIQNYFEKYPAVRDWIDNTIEFAEEHGYVKTQTGRRRHLRDISSRNRSLKKAAERLAMNSPIQGTAADMLKLAMIKVHHELKAGGFKTRMLLTVHDELVFDMHRDESDTVQPLIESCMKTALPLEVPIEVEMGTGENWLEAH